MSRNEDPGKKNESYQREHPDPHEGSALKMVGVPIVMIAFFAGFGACYLLLRTPDLSARDGDSRSSVGKKSELRSEPSSTQAGMPDLAQGKVLFTQKCSACHQAHGNGLPGLFPPLNQSEFVLGEPERLTSIVLRGLTGRIVVKGQGFQGTMPPFRDQMSDAELAAVLSYVRAEWDNQAPAVSERTIAKTRERFKGAPSWNGQDEIAKEFP